MTDGARALQTFQFTRPKHLRDEAHVAMELKRRARAVCRDDAGAFLSAMLQGEESVIGEDRGVRMAKDRENAALMLREELCFALVALRERIERHHLQASINRERVQCFIFCRGSCQLPTWDWNWEANSFPYRSASTARRMAWNQSS